jgi:GTP-dependent phosphoenolpyruvate carboxykinase
VENFRPVSGLVFVVRNGTPLPLTEARQFPSGTVIDALHGSLELIAASGKKGKRYTGIFGGAVFKVTQIGSGPDRGLTTLTLIEGASR